MRTTSSRSPGRNVGSMLDPDTTNLRGRTHANPDVNVVTRNVTAMGTTFLWVR